MKNIKKGQWVFTCGMQPKQFDYFEKRDPRDYINSSFTDEDWDQFLNYDSFVTMDGSYHSVKNCGLNPISEKYALWFIENKCWLLFPNDESDGVWQTYIDKVEELCKRDGIEYEGI